MSKAEKLAAARKKLKEFQEKSKDHSSVSKASSSRCEDIPKNTVEVNARRDFSFDSGSDTREDSGFEQQLGHPLYQTVELISTTYSSDDCGLPHSIPDNNLSSENVSVPTSTQNVLLGQGQEWSENPGNTSRAPVPNASASLQFSTSAPSTAIALTSSTKCMMTCTVSPPLSTDSVATPQTIHQPLSLEHEGPLDTGSPSVESNDFMEAENMLQITDPGGSRGMLANTRSTYESIRQLSQQMSGLITESAQTTAPGETAELECRNQELAALLEIERQCSEQLRLQLQEYQTHMSTLSFQIETARTDAETNLSSKLASAQEQLKLHVQTIGILVAEKTELQSALSLCQAEANLKVSEAEDLQGRLKARRYRVSELEKELMGLRATLETSELSRQVASKELNRLRLDLSEVLAREQQLEEEHVELGHRLATKTEECLSLSKDLHEVRTHLSLAQLRLTQLSSEDSTAMASQVEALHDAKIIKEQQVAELENALKKSGAEHDRSNQHFQQYMRGVESELLEMTEKVRELESQKKSLTEREQSLISHVAELEKKIQDQHKPEQLMFPDKNLQERLSHLEKEKQTLSDELSNVTIYIKQLEDCVQVREAKIHELESMVDHLQGDQPDQIRLLAAMESDKVAAARAVNQNQQLKAELQELQDGFLKLSDCKLDLTNKLEHEQYRCRQLEEQLTHLRAQHQSLAITHEVDHDQSASRNQAVANEQLKTLSKENDEPPKLVAPLTPACTQSAEGMESHESSLIASLSTSTNLPEGERDKLKSQLSKREEGLHSTEETIPCVTQEAMVQLQEQFTKKMTEIADLSDEKQRLEHLVLQLQGETETIGEYIALYQKQRCLLRQRAEEKEMQLKCLAQDREEMRMKLAQLNSLIGRLVAEKAPASKDLITHTDNEFQTEVTNGELLEIKKQVSEKFLVPEKSEAELLSDTKGKGDTAGKILALLSEIGTSNLVDPHQPVEHFHPCAWCSGRLITV